LSLTPEAALRLNHTGDRTAQKRTQIETLLPVHPEQRVKSAG
jgi:hypothetical protein